MPRRRKPKVPSHECGFELIGGGRCTRRVRSANSREYCHQHANVPVPTHPMLAKQLLENATQQALTVNSWSEVDAFGFYEQKYTEAGNARVGRLKRTMSVDLILSVAKQCCIDDPDRTQPYMLPSLRAIAGNRKTPLGLLEILSRHQDNRVRCAVASNSSASEALIAESMQSPSPSVVNSAASNPSATWDIICQMPDMSELSDNVLWRLAQRTDIEFVSALRLVAAANEQVRRRIAEDRFANPEVLYRIAVVTDDYHALIADNPNSDHRSLLRIAKSMNATACETLGRRAEISDEIIDVLSRHDLPNARRQIAQRAGLPVEIMARCAQDTASIVRAAVALRSDVPEALMDLLSADQDEMVRFKVAANTTVGGDCLTLLMMDEAPAVRQAAAVTMQRRS